MQLHALTVLGLVGWLKLVDFFFSFFFFFVVFFFFTVFTFTPVGCLQVVCTNRWTRVTALAASMGALGSTHLTILGWMRPRRQVGLLSLRAGRKPCWNRIPQRWQSNCMPELGKWEISLTLIASLALTAKLADFISEHCHCQAIAIAHFSPCMCFALLHASLQAGPPTFVSCSEHLHGIAGPCCWKVKGPRRAQEPQVQVQPFPLKKEKKRLRR